MTRELLHPDSCRSDDQKQRQLSVSVRPKAADRHIVQLCKSVGLSVYNFLTHHKHRNL